MEETSALEALTAGIDLSVIATAMVSVYEGMIVVGLFLLGGEMIAKRLGWRK